MWLSIKTQLISALVSTAVIASLVAAWNCVSDGTLINLLNGVTDTELEQIEARLLTTDNLEFWFENTTVTQEAEIEAGGPDVILRRLECPDDSWRRGHGFSETYIYEGVRRKYMLLCFRKRATQPESNLIPSTTP